MEISYQLYTWLKNCNILSSTYEPSSQVITLSEFDSQKLELGLILALFPPFLPNLPKDSDFQQANSKVSRLNNWNLLIKPLEALNIPLNSDTKALIVAGDRQQVSGVLQSLYKSLLILNKKTGQGASFDGSLFLNNLNTLIHLNETHSVLEFLVLSFCKAFKVSGKVAVGLLSQNAGYLSQVIKKGLKSEYEPILYWMELILNNFQYLFELLKQENASLGLALNLLKFGITSNSEIVQDKCLEVLHRIMNVLGNLNENLAFSWFVESKVIEDVFTYLENRVDGIEGVRFIILYSNKNFEVFWVDLKEFCKDNLRYLRITQKILPSFIQLDVIDEIFNSGLVSCWIDMCLNSSSGEAEGKGQYVMFICDIWGCFCDFFAGQEELSNNIMTFLKKIIRDSSKGLKILCLGQIFEIFNSFTVKQVKYAPILYKILVFSLNEHYGNLAVREFVLVNFARILSENLTIPLINVVETVVKQALQLNINNFHLFDLDFYVTLSRHPNLSIKEAILLVDLCGKLLTSDTIYSSAAEIPFLITCSRFIEHLPLQDYLIKFISLIFNLKQNSKFYQDKLKNKTIKLTILFEKVVALGSSEFCNRLRKLFAYLVNDIKTIRDKVLERFFSLIFDPGNSAVVLVKDSKQESKLATVSSFSPVRAMYQIEKIRQQREEKEQISRMRTEQKGLKNIIEKFSLKQELKKRRIELGVKSRIDEEDLLILSKPLTPDKTTKFTTIRDELPETQKTLREVFKKFKRVNHSLFTKYSGLGYKNKGSLTPSFERYKTKKAMLTEGDFSLFLKHFSILGPKISVKEMKKIFASLCKNSVKMIPAEDFTELLYMVCSLIAHKNPMLCKLPEVLWLLDFYSNLEMCCEGLIPRYFFTEPDPGYADRDVIRALNKNLEKDPEIQLNENYKKYNEIQVTVRYRALLGKQSLKASIEILDQVLFDCLGFHLLLPTVRVSYKTRAKGILKAEDSKQALGYLNKIESNPGFFKLSSHIKVHAINLEYPEDIIIECSKLIDDMIYTIEKNSYELISRLPKPVGSVSNKFLQEKYLNEAEKMIEFERSEEKRKNRAKTLEKLMEKNRMDKEWRVIVENQQRIVADKRAKLKEFEETRAKKQKKVEVDEMIAKYKQKKSEEAKEKERQESKLKEKSQEKNKNKLKEKTKEKEAKEGLIKDIKPIEKIKPIENLITLPKTEKITSKINNSAKSYLTSIEESIKLKVPQKLSSRIQKSFLNDSQQIHKSSSVPKSTSQIFKRV